MSGVARVASDPLPSIVSWIVAHGVAVESWPSASPPATRSPLGHPILYLVEPGAAPPDTSASLEDWVRLPVDPEMLLARVDALLAQAAGLGAVLTYVDEDNVLRVGSEIAVLSPLEARLMRVLLAHAGRLVSREEVAQEVWPDGPPADEWALYNRVRRLRTRLSHLPLRIHTIRGRGLLLEHRN